MVNVSIEILILNGSVSGAFPVSYGVPQGSVLGPFLSLLNTTPLSHLIQATDINHHLSANDTQLYISFKPENLNEAMSALCKAFHSTSTCILRSSKPAGFKSKKDVMPSYQQATATFQTYHSFASAYF